MAFHSYTRYSPCLLILIQACIEGHKYFDVPVLEQVDQIHELMQDDYGCPTKPLNEHTKYKSARFSVLLQV